jgi:uncharacterized membrane protein YoaK (UPF0700 family)
MIARRTEVAEASTGVLMLALTSGALDAVGFLIAQVFTGNQTGNLVIISMSVVGAGFPHAVQLSIIAFLAFAVGVLVALGLRRLWGRRHGERRTLLLAEVAVILLAAVVLRVDPASVTLIPLLGVAQGIQGVAVTSVLGVGVRTVVVTGSILDVGKHFADRQVDKGTISLASPVGYAIGAIVGALVYSASPPVTLLCAAVAGTISATMFRRLATRSPAAFTAT